MNGTVSKLNTSDSLTFAPATTSVHSPQSADFTDSRSCGERLDVPNLAQNLEVHEAIVTKPFNTVNGAEIGRSLPSARTPREAFDTSRGTSILQRNMVL